MSGGNPLIAVGSTSTISYNRAADQLNFTIANSSTFQINQAYLAAFKPVVGPMYTVAAGPNRLPSTAPWRVTGSRAFVTDASNTTFYSIVVGGGSLTVPVFCDEGGNWRIG
jgi:hypothetical protein